MSSVAFEVKYQADTNVLVTQSDDETVFVHLGTDRTLHSNATGSRIWELLLEGATFSEIVASLSQEYNQPSDRIEGEVGQFVEQLLTEGLITKVGADQ